MALQVVVDREVERGGVGIIDLMNKGLNTEARVQRPDDRGLVRS